MEKTDPFWVEEPTILFQFNRIKEFFPAKKMSKEEKYNALSRFLIYLGVLLFFYFGNPYWVLLPIIGLTILWIIYYNHFNLLNIESFKENEMTTSDDSEAQTCQKPTPENPFMNVMLTDYVSNPNKNSACLHSDPQITQKVEKYFDNNLYKDVEDLWDHRNSQRQYITTPVTTIPNDRESFMKWCWGTTNVCKEGDCTI